VNQLSHAKPLVQAYGFHFPVDVMLALNRAVSFQ
jgi:hypothetical protein